MTLKQEELSDQIQLAAKEPRAQQAWLFGSYDRNEVHDDSKKCDKQQ
jgi:predicted nucleotidyltransferase